MTTKEIAALDKKMEALKPKISKAKKTYDDLVEQYAVLLERRYPERKEDAIKEKLYKAYKSSNKDIDFIVDFIENAPDEDDYWN